MSDKRICAVPLRTRYFCADISERQANLYLLRKSDMSAAPTRYVLCRQTRAKSDKNVWRLRTRYILPCQTFRISVKAPNGKMRRYLAAFCRKSHIVVAKSNAYRYFTLLRSISGVQRHAARTISNSAAGSLYILPFGTSYVFVYEDNYAGQTSINLRADLDKGAAGNTCCIVKAHLCKGVRKDTSYCVPA